jgi:hypothetical protein
MFDAELKNADHVSGTKMVLPSSWIKETLDGCHVAEVTPPNPTMAFQMVVRDPPPLALLALGFPPDRQLSAPLAPDVAEKMDHMGVIPGPNGHKVSVPPPRAPSLATGRADRHEDGSMNKKEAKWKKRKDRE